MKIVLIGAGNVAVHLGPELNRKGNKIVQIFSRSASSANSLAKKLKCRSTTDPKKIISDADFYIVALRDEAIASFLSKLSFTPQLIVHTSGSVGIEAFPNSMKNSGVLYPLQTFTKSIRHKPESFPICIEARNNKSLIAIRKISKSISPAVYEFNSQERTVIHLAAVFVNNFTNHLFTLAGKLLEKENISFDILRPLIMETALKVMDNLPENVQTGPARRGDATTILKHERLLKKFPDIKVIYRELSKSIENEYGKEL